MTEEELKELLRDIWSREVSAVEQDNTNWADNVRVGFEQWYSGGNAKCPSIRRDSNGNYTLMQAHQAWLAWWQAAIQFHNPS
jgi:hypothetical protein